MAQDISGFNTRVSIVADETFPAGIVISQFADDSDPLDIQSIKVADTAMGLNGDFLKWSKAVVIPMVLNVIPASDDDIDLGILLEANRVGQGKTSANDEITATVVYPDGTVIILSGGAITDGMPGKSIAGSGRLKTKSYMFSFQNKVGT